MYQVLVTAEMMAYSLMALDPVAVNLNKILGDLH
jgi:hypothetical protein